MRPLVVRCQHGSRLVGQRCLDCDPLVVAPVVRRRTSASWVDAAAIAALAWAIGLVFMLALVGLLAGGCGRSGVRPTCPVKAPQATDSGPGPGGGAGSDCVLR